jgi:hypothetical protein
LKEHRITTVFGHVRVMRSLYWDNSGDYRRSYPIQLRSYLMANAFGLRDYRFEVDGDGLRGLGEIEGNADKLAANRMKKRGMIWMIKGAQRMTRLVNLREAESFTPA